MRESAAARDSGRTSVIVLALVVCVDTRDRTGGPDYCGGSRS